MTLSHCWKQRGTLIETNYAASFHSVNWAGEEEGGGYTSSCWNKAYIPINLRIILFLCVAESKHSDGCNFFLKKNATTAGQNKSIQKRDDQRRQQGADSSKSRGNERKLERRRRKTTAFTRMVTQEAGDSKWQSRLSILAAVRTFEKAKPTN